MTEHGIVLIVGTGTDVGKTHVTAALARAAHATMRVTAWKPVTSGGLEDVERLTAASDEAVPPPIHALASAISPHLAAREEGVTISLAKIVDAARELKNRCDVLFVETAGGLYSPLTDTETNADLARALGEATVLLVAPDRLGVLHDVGAVVRAARADGLAVSAVALSAPLRGDRSTGTNAAELRTLGLAQDVVTFPRAGVHDDVTISAARACLSAILKFRAAARP